jgi:3'-phosphoadenosine 5'-phosphosulfate sulfotransferase (PAPS reductase)/FAD synthetase
MKVICWWSGGITSAVACKLAIDMFGRENCKVIMLDTKNEHEDTYRFKRDCEKWYGAEIYSESVIGVKYDSIEDIWIRFKSLNVAHGAICSTEAKRELRHEIQKKEEYDHQVFGFEFDKKEFNRAKSLSIQHSDAKPIYPLLMFGYDKKKCLEVVSEAGIEVPEAYRLGFKNNNCLNTGCVQGGIGYWQKMKREFPDKYEKMAEMEHKLTELKGSPVTMLKDQSKAAKDSGDILVFLKKHPSYPNLKSLDEMEGREVEPLMECNGFCGTNDLNDRSKTEQEINFQMESV